MRWPRRSAVLDLLKARGQVSDEDFEGLRPSPFVNAGIRFIEEMPRCEGRNRL